MRPVVTRGQAGRIAARFALAAGVLALLVLGWGGTASGDPYGRQFDLVHGPIVWNALPAGGTEQRSPVTLDVAELATGENQVDSIGLDPHQNYLYVAVHPNYLFAGLETPLVMPRTAATLVTPDGTVTGIAPSRQYGDDGSWYFPVARDLTTATLDVAPFSKVIGNDRGDFVNWTFTPSPISLVGKPVAPVHAATTTTTTVPVQPKPVHRLDQPKLAQPKSGGTPLAVPIGIGAGGAAVLGAASAGLTSLTRRRAFYRADRAGRIVLSGPPPLVAGTGAVVGQVLGRGRASIVVKLLGWLEVEGAKRPVVSGPVLEIIVFLVLNPGRSFTSVQLRESIWGLGRQPLASSTFRNYMVQLRKAFGTGVVVTDRQRYEMTAEITSDWDQFRAALQADDLTAGREEALSLVRGPVLHGCFDGKKNSPFSWAVGAANDIEDTVTFTAVELADDLLDSDNPLGAAKAVSQGLLCAETHLQLRILDMRIAARLGGQQQIGKRLERGRAALAGFPNDVARLEDEARSLGWAPVVSG
jgi:DNA-binding SARP family transcriptional activator